MQVEVRTREEKKKGGGERDEKEGAGESRHRSLTLRDLTVLRSAVIPPSLKGASELFSIVIRISRECGCFRFTINHHFSARYHSKHAWHSDYSYRRGFDYKDWNAQ